MALFSKKDKPTLTLRLQEMGGVCTATVYRNDRPSEPLELTTHEELSLGIILEWREGYDKYLTKEYFLSDQHSQHERVTKWAKALFKEYEKED